MAPRCTAPRVAPVLSTFRDKLRDDPPLRGVVLRGPGDESVVFLLNLMRIHKSAAAFLLDRVGVVAQGSQNPLLGSVVLPRPGDDGVIFLCNFMGIHKSTTLFMLNRVRAAHRRDDPDWGNEEIPRLRLIISRGPRHKSEILLIAMSI